jgi:hypothetical protein
MPYDAWRNLASNRYAVYPAILRARDWGCVSDEIEETYTIDFGDLTFEFEDNDHSFGAFLANKWNWSDLFTQDLPHTNKAFIDLGTCTATATSAYTSLSDTLDNLSYAIAENQKSVMEINGDLIINKQNLIKFFLIKFLIIIIIHTKNNFERIVILFQPVVNC